MRKFKKVYYKFSNKYGTNFRDAWTFSSLFLILLKLGCFFLADIKTTFQFNITFLIIVTGIAWKFMLMYYLKYFLVIFFFTNKRFFHRLTFDADNTGWEKDEWGFFKTINLADYPIPKTFIQKSVENILLSLIFLRLLFRSYTLVYTFIRFLIFFWLIFNNFAIYWGFFALIERFSRIIFYFSFRRNADFVSIYKKLLAYPSEIIEDRTKTVGKIKASINNAKIHYGISIHCLLSNHFEPFMETIDTITTTKEEMIRAFVFLSYHDDYKRTYHYTGIGNVREDLCINVILRNFGEVDDLEVENKDNTNIQLLMIFIIICVIISVNYISSSSSNIEEVTELIENLEKK